MRKGERVKIKEYRAWGREWPHLVGLTGEVVERDGQRAVWVRLDDYPTTSCHCMNRDLEKI